MGTNEGSGLVRAFNAAVAVGGINAAAWAAINAQDAPTLGAALITGAIALGRAAVEEMKAEGRRVDPDREGAETILEISRKGSLKGEWLRDRWKHLLKNALDADAEHRITQEDIALADSLNASDMVLMAVLGRCQPEMTHEWWRHPGTISRHGYYKANVHSEQWDRHGFRLSQVPAFLQSWLGGSDPKIPLSELKWSLERRGQAPGTNERTNPHAPALYLVYQSTEAGSGDPIYCAELLPLARRVMNLMVPPLVQPKAPPQK